MFKFKDILEGLFDDLLELPGSWLRTHWAFLRHGAVGFFRIEGRARSKRGGYLRLRTAAFIDVLLLLAFAQADNAFRGQVSSGGTKSFWEFFFSAFVELFSNPFGNAELVKVTLIFFIAYYAFYLILAATGLRRRHTHLFAGGALLTTIAGACVFAVVSLWAFGTPLPFELDVEEALVALLCHGIALGLFLRFGPPLINLLGRRHEQQARVNGLLLGALLFTTYLCVLYAYGAGSMLWPSLSA